MTKPFVSFMILLCYALCLPRVFADTTIPPNRLKEAYPTTIQDVSTQSITWKDGTHMRLNNGNSFFDKLGKFFNNSNNAEPSIAIEDLQCHGIEPFFKKLYGGTEAEVKEKLATVYWMPKIFGHLYPLKITTVNGIDKKIQRISAELEKLPASDYKFLDHPAGSFYWRKVKYEKYLSAHSFGIAIDINSKHANYWMWDWEKLGKPHTKFVLHNSVPMEIVRIFEKEGFLWGGRWYFYDTMHFEYRPELFIKTAKSGLQYNEELAAHCYG
jgi:peptidoglycan LD-endopeptidase CwlK